jgi:hypothetical protein
MPKKPTGNVGPVVAKAGSDGVTGGWEKIEFPDDKDSIERLMFDLWATETRKGGGNILKATKNALDDFDFTLELPGGRVHMDLVELFYRDEEGRPYENDNIEIRIYDYAEQIRDTVIKKSQHYGKVGDTPIHLLLYITHWRFWPSEPVIRLAQHFLNKSPPIIENVFLVLPLTATEGTARVLYPSSDPLEGRNPEEFKDATYLVPDLSKALVVSNIGSASV